jgi:hypothetical protein
MSDMILIIRNCVNFGTVLRVLTIRIMFRHLYVYTVLISSMSHLDGIRLLSVPSRDFIFSGNCFSDLGASDIET